MQSFAVYLYVTAVGFVTAGLPTSFVQLISGQPMRFGIEPCSVLASVGAVLLRGTRRSRHPDAQRLAGRPHRGAAEGLVLSLGGDRGDVEPVVGWVAARRDFDVLIAAEKEEPASWRGRL